MHKKKELTLQQTYPYFVGGHIPARHHELSSLATPVHVVHAFDFVHQLGVQLVNQHEPLAADAVASVYALQVDSCVVATHHKYEPPGILLDNFYIFADPKLRSGIHAQGSPPFVEPLQISPERQEVSSCDPHSDHGLNFRGGVVRTQKDFLLTEYFQPHHKAPPAPLDHRGAPLLVIIIGAVIDTAHEDERGHALVEEGALPVSLKDARGGVVGDCQKTQAFSL